MKALIISLMLASLLFIGCEKDNPTSPKEQTNTPKVSDSTVFYTSDIAKNDVFYNFVMNDTVASTGDWDIKITNQLVAGLPTGIKAPTIILNPLRYTKAATFRNIGFNNFTPDTIKTYAADNGSNYIIGSQFVNYNSSSGKFSIDTNIVFAVKLSGTKFSKLLITSFSDGQIGIKKQIYERVFFFTSTNVKTSPVYFSFLTGDTVSSSGSWDLKLTTLYAPDDSTNSFKFPGIVLNPSVSVTAKYVDGTKFEDVNASAVTGLASDNTGFATYTTRRLHAGPLYFSFDTGDTTTSTGNWDVKMTRDAFAFPIFVLNRAKNVQAKVLDTTVSFETVNQFNISGLYTDPNDTTFVIGQNCFKYDETTHLLSPYANRVFVIKTASGNVVKVRSLNYYNSSNASGYVKFEYYNKKKENYAIGTNCLSYNGTTHILSPYTDRTFVVKTSAGAVAKFKMLTYYNEANASGYMKFQYEVK